MADEAYEEQQKFIKRIFLSVFLALLAGYVCAFLIFPIESWVRLGLDMETLSKAVSFWKKAALHPSVLMQGYVRWWKGFTSASAVPFSFYLPWLPLFVMVGIFLFGIITNPYRYMPNIFGAGRLATMADVKQMGLLNGFVCVLGRFHGKLLKLPETLSVLVTAPPGTGKTVGVVVPTILEADDLSIIVNDVKPELNDMTSGYRAKKGPVFIINWGAQDDPERGIYYPSWNPLSPSCLPPLGPARDMYIDSMVAVLVEDAKGGQDPHWSKSGRNAMSGFLHFITSKCERARANDYFINKLQEGSFDAEDAKILATYYADMSDNSALLALDALQKGQLTLSNYAPVGTWEGLPQDWYGHEPCIAMILEWLTATQMMVAADIKRRTDEGDQMAMMADPMKEVLDAAVNESNRFAYSHRAITELNQLASTPDKERGSILSVALTGISIFKNAAVRERTKFSDLTFRDIRGLPDPVTREMKPISVYLSINQVDAQALNVITGIFVELMSSYLIANKPGQVGADGKKAGPYPVLFVLDEFPQMPKLSAVINGPAVGRGQKVSYLLIGQDLGQISGKYGKDDLETIITTTAVKVVLAQNNEQTAERFSKMIGTKTIEVKSTSKQEGMNTDINQRFSQNVSRSFQQSNVVSIANIMSLDKTKQYVIVQNFTEHPILADAPRYFLDRKFLKRTQIPPAPNVPAWIVARREEVNKLSQVAPEQIEPTADTGLDEPPLKELPPPV
ncbi:MAG: type IV secretory system conjugative DNA transfer family protein [Alphaproteobacteria bacterium]